MLGYFFNFFTDQPRNPWHMLAEPFGSAEPRLKITGLRCCQANTLSLMRDELPAWHCEYLSCCPWSQSSPSSNSPKSNPSPKPSPTPYCYTTRVKSEDNYLPKWMMKGECPASQYEYRSRCLWSQPHGAAPMAECWPLFSSYVLHSLYKVHHN